MMKKEMIFVLILIAQLFNVSCKTAVVVENNQLRAPAVPLLTSDPYFSVWSASDDLNESKTIHWTGKEHPLIGAVRVDGKSYRFMGVEKMSLSAIVPMGTRKPWDARYTETKPAKEWTSLEFNDKKWKKGQGSFANHDFQEFATLWESQDIWVRRTFDLDEDLANQTIFLEYSHDDIFELYINGEKVVETGYEWHNNVVLELDAKIVNGLKKGKNIITAHCHNRVGGAYVDFGLMKKNEVEANFDAKAVQKSVTVAPTQTLYTFECGPVELNLTFTAPLLMEDLDLVSTPINYISYDVKSLDNEKHDVQIYFETTPQLAVNTPSQPVTLERIKNNKLTYLKTGTVKQDVLNQAGDDLRIDWGYLYLAAELSAQESLELGEYFTMKENFIKSGKISTEKRTNAMSNDMFEMMSVLAYSNDLGAVSDEAVKGHLMIGYDDLYSIQYFKQNLLPYWKQNGTVDIYQAFEKASSSYESLIKRCDEFDMQLMIDAEKAGGKAYADLCALSYRQAITAHKLVADRNGDLLFLSKENNSNGCINTVDVTYPSAPLFLIYNPELMKGMLTPIFYYSESGKWKKPFPAHDLGTYPLANGQTYGGDMPVEESGNMLILTTAIAYAEGNANYAKKHWDVLSVWADYLVQEGMDPENQLCTDDFAGHSAHNTNLSIKAIMGIAGYGKLADMLGMKDVAAKYTGIAREMATKWTGMAQDGDHYRLTFDRADTWSQKYNLVWDKVFKLGIFPPEVAEKEIAYYLTKQNKYGLPLDSRKGYTKSDWIMWTASIASTPEDFQELVMPVFDYANETNSRVPLSDWHETTNGNSVGFKARSVVGGYFMKMLDVKMNGNK